MLLCFPEYAAKLFADILKSNNVALCVYNYGFYSTLNDLKRKTVMLRMTCLVCSEMFQDLNPSIFILIIFHEQWKMKYYLDNLRVLSQAS